MGTIVARLMVDRPATFDETDRRRVYSLYDRIFFGVEDFARIEEVPTVTADDYKAMKKVKKPGTITGFLTLFTMIQKLLLKEEVGPGYDDWCTVGNATLDMMFVASARRHGRAVATFADLVNAVETYIGLFETDVANLPAVKRLEPNT